MNSVFIVTGAAGHLGRTIIDSLEFTGCDVLGFDLPSTESICDFPKNVRMFYGDVTVKEDLKKVFEAASAYQKQYVVHCAGIVSITERNKKQVERVNIGGTKNIAELCLQYKVTRLVYVSSVHAIPETGHLLTEVRSFDPETVDGTYAKTKAVAGNVVLKAVADGLDAVIVHPSGLLGPNDHGRGHLTQLVVDFVRGRLTACVKGGYDFVDVRDVADGILRCCSLANRGDTFILSNRYYDIKEILDIISDITGRRKIKTVLPMWFAKSTAPLSVAYYRLLRQPPLYTSYSLSTLTGGAVFSHEKATKQLGYTTRDIKTTLYDEIEWLKKIKRL